MIGATPKTAEGVCRIMVLRWFIEQTKDAPKFWNMMFSQSGRLNSAFVAQLMTQSISLGKVNVPRSTSSKGPDYDALEDADTLAYMKSHGFKGSMAQAATAYPDIFQAAAEFVAHVYEEAKRLHDYTFSVFTILKREGGGHAVGFHIVPGRSILFLDPNLGEFEFTDIERCGDWMTAELGGYYKRRYSKLLRYVLFRAA